MGMFPQPAPQRSQRSQIFRIADVNLHLYLACWVGGLAPWRMAWGLISHPCQVERNASSRESPPKGIFQNGRGCWIRIFRFKPGSCLKPYCKCIAWFQDILPFGSIRVQVVLVWSQLLAFACQKKGGPAGFLRADFFLDSFLVSSYNPSQNRIPSPFGKSIDSRVHLCTWRFPAVPKLTFEV